jgi:hypothetical protein
MARMNLTACARAGGGARAAGQRRRAAAHRHSTGADPGAAAAAVRRGHVVAGAPRPAAACDCGVRRLAPAEQRADPAAWPHVLRAIRSRKVTPGLAAGLQDRAAEKHALASILGPGRAACSTIVVAHRLHTVTSCSHGCTSIVASSGRSLCFAAISCSLHPKTLGYKVRGLVPLASCLRSG